MRLTCGGLLTDGRAALGGAGPACLSLGVCQGLTLVTRAVLEPRTVCRVIRHSAYERRSAKRR